MGIEHYFRRPCNVERKRKCINIVRDYYISINAGKFGETINNRWPRPVVALKALQEEVRCAIKESLAASATRVQWHKFNIIDVWIRKSCGSYLIPRRQQTNLAVYTRVRTDGGK
ncbi:MAG: hypothetical protein EG828_11370 [Deltaproteobacteria bacterium]|nr:hypothetical protein [Deltaproteobacteria bacterium]